MATTITASATNPRKSMLARGGTDLDITVEVGTVECTVLLLVGRVTVAPDEDGILDLAGGPEASLEYWASAELTGDLCILQTADHMRAVAEIRRVAIATATASSKGAR